MPVPGRRQERVADQIRTEVARLIAEDLKDPRIGFTTVTGVDLSADLGHARVFVSVLGGSEAGKPTLEGLNSAAGFVRREITQRLGLRRAPEVVFELDHGAEQAARIEDLLARLKPRE